jgi:hypothetical protein
MLWLVVVAGCGGDLRDARNVAETLCRWGQLDELTPSVLPDEVALSSMVREQDLRFALEEPRRRPSAENPFLALQQTVGMEADSAAKALAAGVAEHVTCELTGTSEARRAEFHIVRKVPRPLRGADSVAKAAELDALATPIERVARVREWIVGAPVEEIDYDLVLEKRNGPWIANFGLPEDAIEDAKTELAEVERSITRMEADQVEIAKLELMATTYFARTPARANPRVDITVRNGLDMRVAKVEFHGLLTSPERPATDPWVDAELTHTVLGRLESGDQETFTIVSRLPARWRTLAPEGSTLELKVTKIAGPSMTWKYDVSGYDDALARRQELNAEIERVQRTYLSEDAAAL